MRCNHRLDSRKPFEFFSFIRHALQCLMNISVLFCNIIIIISNITQKTQKQRNNAANRRKYKVFIKELFISREYTLMINAKKKIIKDILLLSLDLSGSSCCFLFKPSTVTVIILYWITVKYISSLYKIQRHNSSLDRPLLNVFFLLTTRFHRNIQMFELNK